jgi:putative NADPH-quinone reductase
VNKKIVIIDGHPDADPGRLCHALADAYAQGAQDAGHAIKRIDVARLDFPVLRSQRDFDEGSPPAGILSAQDGIRWADHVVIVYPLWLGTMPALLKAFFEQTFRPGFAFKATDNGWPRKQLAGRTARLVVTMGMPALLYRWFYLAHSLRSLERNILKFCGIKPVGETVFGLVETAGDAKRAAWLDKTADLGRRAR